MEHDKDVEGVPESEHQSSTPATMEAEAQPEQHGSMGEPDQPALLDYDEFHRVIMRGDIESVKAMLDAGPKVLLEREASDGVTPLVIAISKRHVDIVQLLLERGADANAFADDSPPLFHATAASEDAPRIMQLLLDHGANIKATAGKTSLTALHVAAVHGDMQAADFLIGKGLDLHGKCEHGKTPLILAAEKGQTMMVKLLLAKGADLHERSANQGTALMWAASTGHVETVKYLLEKGLSPEDRDEQGLIASRAGHEKIVELLIEKGADINAISTEPRKATPAIWAAAYGYEKALKVLIDHEADLSITTDDDIDIIDVALRAGYVKCAKMLTKAIGGPDYPADSVALQIAATTSMAETRPVINTVSLLFPHIAIQGVPPGKWGWIKWVLDQGGELVRHRATLNLLHFALLQEEVDMLAELLRLGVDPNITILDGDTPLHAAVSRDNRKLVQLLLDSGADPARPSNDPEIRSITPLHYAAMRLNTDKKKDTSIVDALLASGRCRLMYGQDELDSTVFAYVLNKFGRWENQVAEKLAFRMVESIPDVNKDRSGEGATLMHVAVMSKNHELVDLLLQKGADINARDKYGFTPFIVACPTTPDEFDFMISQGADPFAVDRLGRSTLYHAASHGSMESVRYLLNLGAANNDENNSLSVNATDHRGWTPLIVAITRDHENMALCLLERGASVTHCTTDKKRTALHYAALYSMHRLVEKILADPAASDIINTHDEQGWTPLSYACIAPSPTVIPQLLSHGADINLRNPLTSDTPLHTALKRPISFCRLDSRYGDPALLLLQHPSISLTLRDAQSRTPLHLAAEYHNLPAAEIILSNKPSISPSDTDSSGKTPLALCSRPDIAEALLAAGADVNHAEPNGWTPVHHAVHRCWVLAYEVLVQHGADLDARTADDGLTVRERMEKMGGERKWKESEVDFITDDLDREKVRERAIKGVL